MRFSFSRAIINLDLVFQYNQFVCTEMTIDHVDKNKKRVAIAIIGIYYDITMKFFMSYYMVSLVMVIRMRRSVLG